MSEITMPEPENPTWTDDDWKTLLIHIKHRKCTPFLGAGAAYPTLPLGRELARKWATDAGYPFSDPDNLVRVAQYIAVHQNELVPKSKVVDEFVKKGPPPITEDEPHHVLASLDLPLYLTTNYDDYMYRALLASAPPKKAVQEYCRWHRALSRRKLPKGKLPYDPSPTSPIVYHLHGVLQDIDSIVITEDDYLNFLILVSEFPDLIPPQVVEAFGNNSLLFLGYSMQDMDFRVLFRRLSNFMQTASGAKHVSVQLSPDSPGSTEDQRKEALAQREYLEKQLGGQKVKVYWGSCAAFCRELGNRWRAYAR